MKIITSILRVVMRDLLRIGNSQNIGITETFSWTMYGQNNIFNKKGLGRKQLSP